MILLKITRILQSGYCPSGKNIIVLSNKPGQTSLVMNFDKQTLKQLEALGYVELEKDKSNNGNGAG